MNLEVASSWLRSAGMKGVHPCHIDPEESVVLHCKACQWLERASREFSPSSPVRAELGECTTEGGIFVGRFLLVKMRGPCPFGGYAVVASVSTSGGARSAGSAMLLEKRHAKSLIEDIGRGMSMPPDSRREAVRTSMRKWAAMNPASWKNPFAPGPSRLHRALFCVLGAVSKISGSARRS